MRLTPSKKARSAIPETAGRLTNPERMVDAAILCFRKYGPAKTSMEDVAKAAQVGRQTVYRTFRTRTELLDAVANRRLEEIGAKVLPVLAACENFEDALIRGSVETMRLARLDRLFIAVLESATDNGVERYLLDPGSPVHEYMLKIWAPVFAQARERGELRQDIGDVDLATWLRGVHLMLLLREDLDEKGQAALLRMFVVPGLVPLVKSPGKVRKKQT